MYFDPLSQHFWVLSDTFMTKKKKKIIHFGKKLFASRNCITFETQQ